MCGILRLMIVCIQCSSFIKPCFRSVDQIATHACRHNTINAFMDAALLLFGILLDWPCGVAMRRRFPLSFIHTRTLSMSMSMGRSPFLSMSYESHHNLYILTIQPSNIVRRRHLASSQCRPSPSLSLFSAAQVRVMRDNRVSYCIVVVEDAEMQDSNV